jgi:hypothetical protein
MNGLFCRESAEFEVVKMVLPVAPEWRLTRVRGEIELQGPLARSIQSDVLGFMVLNRSFLASFGIQTTINC